MTMRVVIQPLAWAIRLWAILLLTALLPPPATAQQPKVETGPAKAMEGDLLELKGSMIRLWGIDAPDRGQMCANRRGRQYDCFRLSRIALERLIGNREVSCTMRASSVRAPKQGICTVEGRDLAATMAAGGWAMAWRQVTGFYIRYEALAVSFRSGMWAGRVEAPWLWRNRQQAEKADAKTLFPPAP